MKKLANITSAGLETQKGATVSLHPKFTFNSTQKCIIINNKKKGTHDHTCLSFSRTPTLPDTDPHPRNASIPPTDAPGTNDTVEDEEEEEDMNVFFEVSIGTYVAIHDEYKWNISFEFLSLWQLLAVLFGSLMLLVVIVAIMSKVGFFKRDKITREQRKVMRESIRKRRSERTSERRERRNENNENRSEQGRDENNDSSNIGNVFVVG